jgi:hypothetical protein
LIISLFVTSQPCRRNGAAAQSKDQVKGKLNTAATAPSRIQESQREVEREREQERERERERDMEREREREREREINQKEREREGEREREVEERERAVEKLQHPVTPKVSITARSAMPPPGRSCRLFLFFHRL